jgi:two-component system sensor kinase FixL
MNWVTILWSLAAGASITLAVTHGLIWLKDRTRHADLAFTVTALAITAIAACELAILSATDTKTFGELLRWTHLPVMVMLVALTCFVRLYFQSGRLWLAGLAIGGRLLVGVVNFLQPVSINYLEIRSLKQIAFLGQPVSVVAEAVTNPWNILANFTVVIVLIFVIDASVALWRRGDPDSRHRAFCVGGSLLVFIILAGGHASLVHEQVIQSPYFITFPFLAILLAMAYQLSLDVNGATRLAKDLLQIQQQMTLAASSAKLVFWSWDIPNDLLWASPEGRLMYGLPPDEPVTLDRSLAVIHPEDREFTRDAIAKALTSGGDYAANYRVEFPDGAVRWIAARGKVVFDSQAKPLRMSGVSIDNTDRNQAEERSRLLVDAAPYAMIMVDSSAKMVLVNTQAEAVFGYPREELLGQPIEMLIPERFSAGHPKLHKGYLANPEARAMGAGRDLFGRRKDGTEVPVEIGLNPIRTSEGRFVLASIIDITERRQAEREALEQRDELFHLARVSSLGQLSGSLAHELNQPLGIILSNAQAAQRMLDQEPPDLAELREILADIVGEDRRAGEVITRLRSLLKRGQTRLIPLALNEVIEDVLRLLRSDIVARGVTIQTALVGGLPQVPGDPVQLQQVLLNLIINGCDAMAENAPLDRILKISTSLQEDKVWVSVEDQGCGLPDGDASRIFQPFVTTKSHGLGIGLSICRSIIAAHHGRLWAEPNAGSGTTFHLELQIAQPPPP